MNLAQLTGHGFCSKLYVSTILLETFEATDIHPNLTQYLNDKPKEADGMSGRLYSSLMLVDYP